MPAPYVPVGEFGLELRCVTPLGVELLEVGPEDGELGVVAPVDPSEFMPELVVPPLFVAGPDVGAEPVVPEPLDDPLLPDPLLLEPPAPDPLAPPALPAPPPPAPAPPPPPAAIATEALAIKRAAVAAKIVDFIFALLIDRLIKQETPCGTRSIAERMCRTRCDTNEPVGRIGLAQLSIGPPAL